ncbi:unnamed protein product [Amoebophrya sp. A25]|nr:unnamed protein product [Amoebophrya sp. A25]|eukprot:GSA25T00006930001.1
MKRAKWGNETVVPLSQKLTAGKSWMLYLEVFYEINVFGQANMVMYCLCPMWQTVWNLSLRGPQSFHYVLATKPDVKPLHVKPSLVVPTTTGGQDDQEDRRTKAMSPTTEKIAALAEGTKRQKKSSASSSSTSAGGATSSSEASSLEDEETRNGFARRPFASDYGTLKK